MITIIAALDPNRVIGSDNDLPWHYPEDLKHFKKLTQDHTIVMGRKTFESLPIRPLPKRKNVVISRNFSHKGVEVYDSLEKALMDQIVPNTANLSDVYIIGGEQIYHQSMEFASKMILTHIHAEHQGNKFFPEIGPEWFNTTTTHHDGFDIREWIKTDR
jgi:dihydrofolate reductase